MKDFLTKIPDTMIRLIAIISLPLFLFSCKQAGAPSAGAFDTTGFQLEDIPGSVYKRAVKMGENGYLQEEGMLHNGLQEGLWITYHAGTPFPAKAASFSGGAYNGPYMEFNERGQLTLRATYKNNKLDGPWGKYSFGRPEIEAHYKAGELDGGYFEYDSRNGKIQKEVNYKNGKQHGMYRFFNEEGKITLEYEYRDGEKVSGGIVEGEQAQ